MEANQNLVNTLNRGGLWAAHGLMEDIFVCCEIEFRKLVTVQNIRKIDSKQLVETLVCDITVHSKFNHLLEKTPIKIDNHVPKDTLKNVIELFVNVRAFSHAKGIVESCKAKQLKTKSKLLRKDIKISMVKHTIYAFEKVVLCSRSINEGDFQWQFYNFSHISCVKGGWRSTKS